MRKKNVKSLKNHSHKIAHAHRTKNNLSSIKINSKWILEEDSMKVRIIGKILTLFL